MSALHRRIQDQQMRACQLVGVLEALEIIDNENVAPNAVTALIGAALNIAVEINSALDSVNLPEGGDA
ncbi:hypothetical protein [Paracoccus denitrificans]|uniref:hypothetical protein n=1 Tax=Paracoccus denitrificans TaxID=266 RepID=UPI003364F407